MRIVAIILCICMVLGLCSCLTTCERADYIWLKAEKMGDFVEGSRQDTDHIDYFGDDAYESLRLETVAFSSRIIGYSPWHPYVMVYSQTGDEKVIIKTATLKERESGTVMFCQELNVEVEFNEESKLENNETLYKKGIIKCEEFWEEETIYFVEGHHADLYVEAEIIKDGVTLSKTIVIEFVVVRYYTYVSKYFW